MKKILLISLIIFLNSFKSVYSEEKDIILIPKNPNILDEEYSDEENNTKISNETIEVNEGQKVVATVRPASFKDVGDSNNASVKNLELPWLYLLIIHLLF